MNGREERLRRELAELPTEIEPARDLWSGIEARLGEDQENGASKPGSREGQKGGSPAEQVTSITSARRWSGLRRRSVPAEWALAASVVMASVVGGTIWASTRSPASDTTLDASAAAQVQDGGSVDAVSPDGAVPDGVSLVSTDLSQYETAAAELEEIIQTGRNVLEPQTLEVLESSLAAIDQAIAEAQQALNSDPGHTGLQRMLQQNHRRKLGLLRQAATAVQSTT